MKISLSMCDVKAAVAAYLHNELGFSQKFNADAIIFKNARAIEDMGFEVDLTPRPKELINDVLERTKDETDNSGSTESLPQKTEKITEDNDGEKETSGKSELKDPDTDPGFNSIFGNLKN